MNPPDNSIKKATSLSVTAYGELLFLDGLRGLAAFYVMVHHARMLLWEGYSNGFSQHPESYSVIGKFFMYLLSFFRYGYEAVLFFFILSGFVIHLRYAKALACTVGIARFDLGQFFWRRVRRLYPPLIAALVITFIFDSFGKSQNFSIYHQSTAYSVINENVFSRLDILTLLGNLLFLMKSYVPVYGSDGPLWSLKFEWWFYAIYPLFWLISRRSISLAVITMALLFLASFWSVFWPIQLLREVFSVMLVWWLGASLADIYTNRIKCSWNIAAWISIALAIAAIIVSPALHSLGVGFGFASFLAVLFELKSRKISLNWLERLKPLGDMSYTIYVIHFPIYVFLSGWIMSRASGGLLPKHFGWVFIGIAAVILISHALHYLVERPFLSRLPRQSHKPIFDVRTAQELSGNQLS